jgi:peptidoglycan/LPS O-acetylase OafA/YrhL
MTATRSSENDARVHARNSFDLLRLVAALAVLVSHQFALAARPEPTVAGWHSLGGIALCVFFVMSGYLVCESWTRDPNLWRFAARRLLRIWPALAVVVVLSACVLGPVLTTVPRHDYVADPLFVRYFNLLRFVDAFDLPGVFTGNPLRTVNGSLWTLSIEFRWYVYLALGGVIGLVRGRWLLFAIVIGMAIHYFFVFDVERAMAAGVARRWKEELGLYFVAGACLQRFASEWSRAPRVSACVVAVVGGLLLVGGRHHAAYWLWLSCGTILLARLPSRASAALGRRLGDLSYGVYIYAFPVQQIVVATTGGTWSFAAQLVAAAIVTLACAWISWHAIEAPALKLKPVAPRPMTGAPPLRAWTSRTFGWMRSLPA